MLHGRRPAAVPKWPQKWDLVLRRLTTMNPGSVTHRRLLWRHCSAGRSPVRHCKWCGPWGFAVRNHWLGDGDLKLDVSVFHV